MKLSVVIAILLVIIAVCRGDDFWKDPETRTNTEVMEWFKDCEGKLNAGEQGFENNMRKLYFSKHAIVARDGGALYGTEAIEGWLVTSFGPGSSKWTVFENIRVFGSGGPYAVLAEMKVYTYNVGGDNPNGEPINHYMLTAFVSPFRGTLRVTEWSEMPDPDFGYGSTQVEDVEDVIFGNGLVARDEIVIGTNVVVIPEPSKTIDTAGRVTKVQFYAERAGRVVIQVWTPQGGPNYKLVGEVQLVANTGSEEQIISVDVPAADVISVNTGDVIGFREDGVNPIPFNLVNAGGSSEYLITIMETAPPVDSITTLSICPCPWKAVFSFQITISE